MSRMCTTLAAAVLVALTAPAAFATQGCGGDWTVEAASFSGEIYGAHEFSAKVGPNTFVLAPAPHGWAITMRDAEGRDMLAKAAPLRMVEVNPVNIAGWHFRNLDNTGPNRGEVNAPQHQRDFFFGRMAHDPTVNPLLIVPQTPQGPGDRIIPGDRGRGELIIEEMGLADLEPGQKARMVYLKFHGCLEWPTGQTQPTLAQSADPEIPDDVAQAMASCGLPAATYKLSGRMGHGREGGQNVAQIADMDGDHLVDLVVPVTRVADAAPGLAICLRKDRSLVLAGFSGRIGKHLDPVYLGRADYWSIYDKGPVFQGVGEDDPPLLRGDAILLGKEGASSVLVYLDDRGRVASYWQGD